MIQTLKKRYSPPTGDGAIFTVRQLWVLMIPIMIEQTLSGLMGVADTLMVTQLGEVAVSGVTCADVINQLLQVIFEALAVGGNVVCAHCIGAGKDKDAQDVSSQFMAFQLLLSLSITLLTVLFYRQILLLLYPSAEPAVAQCTQAYFRITLLSYPFLALYCGSAALYRAIGNSKLPVIVISTGNFLNVLGNAILIFAFHMGVNGAAWSTLFSRVFSCVVLLLFQFRKGQPISLSGLRGFRFRKAPIVSILKIGVPASLENGMFQLGKIVVQANVVSLGTSAIAAQAIIMQIDVFGSRPVQAMGIALLTVAGQYIGADRPELAKQSTRYVLFLSVIGTIFTGVFTQAITPFLCSLVSLSPETSSLVFHLMIFINVSRVILWPRGFQLPYALKAAGDVTVPAIITMVSMWLVRVGGGFLLCRLFALGLWGVWIGWISDWVVRLIFFSIRFSKIGKTKPDLAFRKLN